MAAKLGLAEYDRGIAAGLMRLMYEDSGELLKRVIQPGCARGLFAADGPLCGHCRGRWPGAPDVPRCRQAQLMLVALFSLVCLLPITLLWRLSDLATLCGRLHQHFRSVKPHSSC